MRFPGAVLLATGNDGKRAELRAWLRTHGVAELAPRAVPEIDEPHAALWANASRKAAHAAACTGLPCLADDSGLLGLPPTPCADSGETVSFGVHTRRDALTLGGFEAAARWICDHHAGRSVTLRCAVALALPGGAVFVGHGSTRGVVASTPRPGVAAPACVLAGSVGWSDAQAQPQRSMALALLLRRVRAGRALPRLDLL